MKNSKGMIILLVALAALTLVVVVGLFFFYPKDQTKAVATPAPGTTASPATPLPNEFDPVEWTRNPQTAPIQTPAPGTTDDQGFTVTLPPESKTPTPQNPGPGTGVTFPGDTVPAKPSTVKSTPVAQAPAKVPVAAPAKAPAAKPAPKPVKTVKVTEYWIQVGSFKDRYQAENTAKALENQGLKGTLTTATVNGQAVVRVRVGPYTNEAEAGKFLAWLKPVKEFDGSYITKASAARVQ